MRESLQPLDYVEIFPARHLFIVRDLSQAGILRARLSYIHIEGQDKEWPYQRVGPEQVGFPMQEHYSVIARDPDDIHVLASLCDITVRFRPQVVDYAMLERDGALRSIIASLSEFSPTLKPCDFAVIGSRLFGVVRDDSDVDLVLLNPSKIAILRQALMGLVAAREVRRISLDKDGRIRHRMKQSDPKTLLKAYDSQWFRKYESREGVVFNFAFSDPGWFPSPIHSIIDKIEFCAKVLDAEKSYASPFTYIIRPVVVGQDHPGVRLVTYRWAYRYAFQPGDEIHVRGKMLAGREDHFVLVDSSEDFIRQALSANHA